MLNFKKMAICAVFLVGLNLFHQTNSLCMIVVSEQIVLTDELLDEIGKTFESFSKYTERQRYVALGNIQDELLMTVLRIYQSARKERKVLQDFLGKNGDLFSKMPIILINICKKVVVELETNDKLKTHIETNFKKFEFHKKQVLDSLNGISAMINSKPLERCAKDQINSTKIRQVELLLETCNFNRLLSVFESWITNFMCSKLQISENTVQDLMIHEQFLNLTKEAILETFTEREIADVLSFFQSNSFKILLSNLNQLLDAIFSQLNPALGSKVKKLLSN